MKSSTATADQATAQQGIVTIGVLAMQGDFREHAALLDEIKCATTPVRTAGDLERCDALVIPGGESTSIRMLLEWHQLTAPLRTRINEGMPVLGTCAGLITLGNAREDAAPPTLGLLDVDLERNFYGRQVASFEEDVTFTEAAGSYAGTTVTGVFIRAPRLSRIGAGVEVLAELPDGEPVVVREGNLVGCAFHPELAGVAELHRILVDMTRGGTRGRA